MLINIGPSVRDEINSLLKDIDLPIAKRLQLGRKLGLSPSKLQEIELEALKEKDKYRRKQTAMRKIVYNWVDENPKATYSKFLVILSEDEEHKPKADRQYTPEELIGAKAPSPKEMNEVLEKLYPNRNGSSEDDEQTEGFNWTDIGQWLKKAPQRMTTWNELIEKLDAENLDSTKLRDFLFKDEGEINSRMLRFVIV